MGGDLGRLGARPLPGRQSVGAAGAQKFAFPAPEQGARDQTFRLIVKPDVWGPQARLRLSNAFGTKPVTFDGVFVGLQESGAAVVKGTNQPVHVRRPGRASPSRRAESSWSDAVALPFVTTPPQPTLRGRKLAVSFHVAGESGPMTWHAKALQTSYVTAPGAGAQGKAEDEARVPLFAPPPGSSSTRST